MRYLLDTNIIISILKNRSERGERAAARLAMEESENVFSCSIVDGELYSGALGYEQPHKRKAAVDRFLAPYTSLPFDSACVPRYAAIRHHLEKRGEIIGGNDLMIAAVALTHALTLVTHNSAEFGRVPGLSWENWA